MFILPILNSDLNIEVLHENSIQLESLNLSQVPDSVYQLSDIKNSNWAYQSWQSLAKRYDCPTNNFDLTKSDNSSLTRSEFAFALHACFNQFLSRLNQTESTVANADLRIWQRLQTDFANELAALDSHKIGNLETRTQSLEKNIFSPTTKLKGEVLLQLIDSFGNSTDKNRDETQTSFGSRAKLNLITSFYGSDVLKTNISSSDLGKLNLITDTVMTRLGAEGNDNGQAKIKTSYRFLLDHHTSVGIGTSGNGVQDAAEVLNPWSSSSKGAISRFGRRDPATLRGYGSAGITVQHEFNDFLQGNIGYSTKKNNSPDKGLFGDSYNAIAQIVVKPSHEFELAFAYTHKYQSEDNVNLMGSTGSDNSNHPFGDNATSSDNWGLQFNCSISNHFKFGGWLGYTLAENKQRDSQNATILNGALSLTFPDLGHEGNIGGVIIGIPPLVTAHDDPAFEDTRTSWHIEALYRMKISDNIEIDPGFFLITAPNHEDNDPIWLGTIRTRFGF